MRVVRRSVSVGIDWLQVVSISLLFPWVLLHEASHAVAALPWSDSIAVSIYPPQASIVFEDSSRSVLAVVGLAPTIVGYAIAAIVVAVVGWPVWFGLVDLYVLLGWLVLTIPSPGDVRPVLSN
ncbi:hypothetical protein D8Y22_12810 [Salinadaptatus halalkaliphilus]|uniref:DUF3267 domain-containing protein n=1 Tax=Salinadaptatus halalkaliphilus TaxID=2419781 RepID=A0A4S3TPJ8_9EURY|nr:hypothetical protein [Salinadaptatus halalkaliphilus]THE64518.1 hypothetical protein D8Y22_12810 [Salinadaptatus halalkaliphilus]